MPRKGCPCAATCCDDPKPQPSDEPERDAEGEINEEHFRTDCTSCGAVCYCDL